MGTRGSVCKMRWGMGGSMDETRLARSWELLKLADGDALYYFLFCIYLFEFFYNKKKLKKKPLWGIIRQIQNMGQSTLWSL